MSSVSEQFVFDYEIVFSEELVFGYEIIGDISHCLTDDEISTLFSRTIFVK